SQRQRRRVGTDHGRTEAAASGGPRHHSRDGREESRERSDAAGECGDPEVARGQHVGRCAENPVASLLTGETPFAGLAGGNTCFEYREFVAPALTSKAR